MYNSVLNSWPKESYSTCIFGKLLAIVLLSLSYLTTILFVNIVLRKYVVIWIIYVCELSSCVCTQHIS